MDIKTNIKNIACLGKTMPLCNKQHLSNIWGSVHWKVKQHWGWVKKSVAYKKSVHYKSVNFTAYFVKIHVISNLWNSVTFFASLFY